MERINVKEDEMYDLSNQNNFIEICEEMKDLKGNVYEALNVKTKKDISILFCKLSCLLKFIYSDEYSLDGIKRNESVNKLQDSDSHNFLFEEVQSKVISHNVFCIIFLFLKYKNHENGIFYIEYLDKLFCIAVSRLRCLDQLDRFFISELCKNIITNIKYSYIRQNIKSIGFFSTMMLYKSNKLQNDLVIFGLEILIEIIRNEYFEELLDIISKDMPHFTNIKINELRLKGYLLLNIFLSLCIERNEKEVFEKYFYSIFDYDNSLDIKKIYEDVFMEIIVSKSSSRNSDLFTLHFLKYYLAKVDSMIDSCGFKIFCRGLTNIINFSTDCFKHEELDKESDDIKNDYQINEILAQKNYVIKKGIFHLFSIIAQFKKEKRSCRKKLKKDEKHSLDTKQKNLDYVDSNSVYYAAKTVCNINFSCLSITHGIKKKAIALLKPSLKKSYTIFKSAAHVISFIKPSILLKELKNRIDIEKKKTIFDLIKTKYNCEAVINCYLELLNGGYSNEIKYEIKDLPLFYKVFSTFSDKSVCKFINIKVDKIEYVYGADFALYCSEHSKAKLDPVYLSSLIIDENDLTNINKLSFYVKILQAISNITESISYQLRKRFISKLKTLIFYNPYTKHAGYLIYKLGFNGFQIVGSNPYNLVIMASCNHPSFKSLFSEFEWSENKERALIYYLRFQPEEFGKIYKWKLNEILNRIYDVKEEKECMLILEILKFLHDSFKEGYFQNGNDASFYFNYINQNQDKIIACCNSKFKSIRLQSNLLLVRSTHNKSILPEVSVPVIISFHKTCPKIIQLYEYVVIKYINVIIDHKIAEFKNLRKIEDVFFLYNIYTYVKDKDIFLEKIVLDNDIFRTYIIAINNMYFSKKDGVFKKIKSAFFSISDEKDHVIYNWPLRFVNEFSPEKSQKLTLIEEHELFEND